MAHELKILILEDVEFDAELIQREMHREGLNFTSRRVETEGGFIQELEDFRPDMILVDHSLPQFDGVTALEIAKEKTPYTPFIFVSGKIDDEFAVDVLKKGATDYVFKSNLSKLVPAIKRALNERFELIERKKAENELKIAYNEMEKRIQSRTQELSDINQKLVGEIAERKVVETALRESENRNNSLLQAIPDMMFIISEDGMYTHYRGEQDSPTSPEETTKNSISNIGISDDDLDRAMKTIQETMNKDTLQNFEFHLTSESGLKYYEARIKKLNDSEALCIVRDITERKDIEDKVKRSLKEKDVLLREIHHRVKNNLQIVSSLLSLQSRHLSDHDTVEIFNESQCRIKSMALIHEKLYQTGDLTRINLADYTNELVNDLYHSYSVNTYLVKYNIKSQNILLDINTAIPCGLIINELVTNSIKHAFPGKMEGEINIGITCEGEYFVMKVEDNGVGLPPDLDIDNVKTLGLQLVTSLTKQLDGTIELERKEGTCFKIRFNEQGCK